MPMVSPDKQKQTQKHVLENFRSLTLQWYHGCK